jgi:hypothetical protein
VFPARHGGARRIEGLLQRLRHEFDIVLVTDEASLYDARSFAHFDGLREVVMVQRPERTGSKACIHLNERVEAHCHRALMDAVQDALIAAYLKRGFYEPNPSELPPVAQILRYFDRLERGWLERVSTSIAHRGPDAEQRHVGNDVGEQLCVLHLSGHHSAVDAFLM